MSKQTPLFGSRVGPWKVSGAMLAAILFALAGPVLLVGCVSYWERKDLEREQRELQQRQGRLEQELQQVTRGRSEFTEAEKARAGPLWVDLRKVQSRLAEVQARLQALD